MATIPNVVAASRPNPDDDDHPRFLYQQSTGPGVLGWLRRAWAKPARWGFFNEPNTAWIGLLYIATACSFLLASCSAGNASRDDQSGGRTDSMPYVIPASMSRVGTIDERFQSYNVEMLEVTGGKFWKPYRQELDALLQKGRQAAAATPRGGDTPAGMNPALYEYRPPIDLTNEQLRRLAKGLAPAYMRVSGTWANTTYFPDSDRAPKSPPAGFNGMLTRQQWKGVIAFAHAVDARIVTSFAISPGTRDAAGVWTPAQASRLLEYTNLVGGRIAAAEFMNEPNLASMGGAPVGYDASAYGRDFKLFRLFAKRSHPEMLILGPGSVGETTGAWGVAYGTAPVLNTRDLLVASGPGIDAFSYHHYGATSRRCASVGKQTTVDAALSEEWLARTDQTLVFYRKLRDEFEPGKPFWNTETADTACGGNPWGSTFLDAFRYLDQLGRLAKQEVHVVAHNTLVASDYGLLDETTLTPRPNYWAALLWRRLMGTTVLESGIPIQEGLHVYAHCLRDTPGGVALLAMNNNRTVPSTIAIPASSERYTLAGGNLDSRKVQLHGNELSLTPKGELPRITGVVTAPGQLTLEPATISFFALPRAGNAACM